MREMKWPVDEFDWHVYAEFLEIKMRDKYTCVTIFLRGTQSYLYQWHSFNTSSQQNILTLPEELYEGLKAELSACK